MSIQARILMVEDSESLSAIYQGYLQDTDYRVISVDSLASAKRMLERFTPEIVLLDVELPDGNGMDLMAEFNDLATRPLVIVMTAYGTSDMAVEAIRLLVTGE